MPKALEGESTRGGLFPLSCSPPLVSGVRGTSPKKTFEFLALLCAFLMGFLCVWDQILVILVKNIFLVT